MRLHMSRGSAPHSSQLLSILLVKLITHTAIEEGWGIDGASSDFRMTRLEAWCKEREHIFGNDSPQAFPVTFSVYQDGILAVAIGKKAVKQI